MEPWLLGLSANSALTVVFAAVGGTILADATRDPTRRVRTLGATMGVLFLADALMHGIKVGYLVLPSFGVQMGSQEAARAQAAEWPLWLLDLLVAAVGFTYVILRAQGAGSGRAHAEETRERRRQAIEIHDGIIQGIAEAKLALAHGEREASLRALEETLGRSRHIISGLLDAEGAESSLRPGELRRSEPAGGGT